MIAELSAIVAGINAAASAIKSVAEAGESVTTISHVIADLGSKEVQLSRLQNTGRLSERDAIAAALAKKQLQETKQEIKDLFYFTVNVQLWDECMQQLADARKAEQERLKREVAEKAKRRKEMLELVVISVISISLVPIVVGLVLFLLT